MSKHPKLAEALIVALAFVAVTAASQVFQRPISRDGGKGWDGAEYHRIAEQLSRGESPSTSAPYVYRIGTPLLAAWLSPHDLVAGFARVNLAACVLSTVLLVAWLRRHLRSWSCRTILCVLFVSQWLGPVRFVHFYPVYVDPWALVFVLGGLIAADVAAADPRSPWPPAALAAIAFVGVAFREVVALVPLALLFAKAPIDPRRPLAAHAESLRGIPRLFWLPPAAALVGWLCVQGIVEPVGSASAILSAGVWAYKKSVASWLLGWFIAFGPLVTVACYYWRETLDFLLQRQHLLVYLASISLLGFVGGSDTERILYWSMPVVFVLIGRVLEAHRDELRSRVWLGVLVSTQLVSQRVFWTTPDPSGGLPSEIPFLTPLGSDVRYLDLYSHHGDPRVETIMLVEYLAVALVLVMLMRRDRRRLSTRSRRPLEDPR